MKSDIVMRRVLLVAAVFNAFAVLVILFPDSVGKVADLPMPGSHFYTWMLALFIGIFAGVYVWLAFRPKIDRPLVVVAAIGKFGVFFVALASWQLEEISVKSLGPAVADLLFGLVFLWWLQVSNRSGNWISSS